jgi:hypothetical protein
LATLPAVAGSVFSQTISYIHADAAVSRISADLTEDGFAADLEELLGAVLISPAAYQVEEWTAGGDMCIEVGASGLVPTRLRDLNRVAYR